MDVSRRACCSSFAASLVGVWPAAAHGFHAAFTVIEHNARTGLLEIFHRIFIQDLEVVLTARRGETFKLDDTALSQKFVEEYLLDVFSITDAEGQRLRPNWVGMKFQVDTLFVYREIEVAAPPKALAINDQTLTETNQGQVNSVNVTVSGRTQTTVFVVNDPPQTLTF